MEYNISRSALDPPDHIARRWSRWLKARGFKGSLEEMEQAYLESEGYDNSTAKPPPMAV